MSSRSESLSARRSVDRTSEISDEIANRKRSSRACDQCRRTKSKCRRSSDPTKPCSTCAAADIPCTFQEPSYKRGPPKGYIHAIELRLRQVESILGTIIGSRDERSQSLVAALKKDDLAREIVNRVDTGPFGPTGRISYKSGFSQEAFITAITQPYGRAKSDRAKRDSRVTREIVSSTRDELPSPTHEWQDNLTALLQSTFKPGVSQRLVDEILSPISPDRFFGQTGGATANVVSPLQMKSKKPDLTSDEFYTMDVSSDEGALDQQVGGAEGLGHLSIDETNEVRFHDETSGMPLLERITDRSDTRNWGGIWQMPSARVWPYAPKHLLNGATNEEDIQVQLPSRSQQELLIDIYFSHVHPFLPVVHKPTFLSHFNSNLSSDIESRTESHGHKKRKNISKLLLLSMFAVSSRYCQKEPPKISENEMWEAGCDYLSDARRILNAVFDQSALATCQALVILAYREFGIGALRQSWLYTGMAIRMAQDLGLHRASDQWQRFGFHLFSPEEKQERKQVWWSCAIVDKYVSCALGRPAAICERDYDTDLPDRDVTTDPILGKEEESFWTPHDMVPSVGNYTPSTGYTYSCFRAAASLSKILGVVIDKVYSVRPKSSEKQQEQMKSAARMLEQWTRDLPDYLQLHNLDTSLETRVPPHILTMHIQYWSVVILLYRKSVRPQRRQDNSVVCNNLSMQAFTICEDAAHQMNKLFVLYRRAFKLQAGSAFLPSYLFNEGIVHLTSLALKHHYAAAAVELDHVFSCLKDLEIVWPSAARNRELLTGAKLRSELVKQTATAEEGYGGKRDEEGSLDDFQLRNSVNEDQEVIVPTNSMRAFNPGAQMMAHMLGLNVSQPSTRLAYDSWPIITHDSTYSNLSSANPPISFTPYQPEAGITGSSTMNRSLNSQEMVTEEWLQNASNEIFSPFGNFDFRSYDNFDRHF